MTWDATRYGSHAETGTPRASNTWFLAEGATHSGFDLFYLIQNPGNATVTVDVEYLLPASPAVVRSYAIGARSRFNVWVNHEDPALAATDVSAVVTASAPIVVERAMYRTASGGAAFEAGHASAGVTAPALKWFLAEGATGTFFDEFVLVANPNPAAAQVRVTYLLPSGSPIVKTYTVGARSRYTIWVDLESPQLASTPVSATVESLNGQPILVERAMWWPGPSVATWSEAHNSPGTTVAGARWALAEGEVGGADAASTYVLVANTSPTAGQAQVTLYFEGGGSATRTYALAANSRTTVGVEFDFPTAAGRRFATVVDSLGASPVSIVVERAMYTASLGRAWAAGTNAVGTMLSGVAPAPGTPPSSVVSIEATDATASEAGASEGLFTVTRTNPAGPLTVYLTAVGSAAAADYQPIARVLSFAAGQSAATIPIVPVDDTAVEWDETVVVVIADSPDYLIGTPSARVAIADDDVSAGTTPASPQDAVRFLTQATFGPTDADIARVQQVGYRTWFDQQLLAPQSAFLGYMDAMAAAGETISQNQLQEAWFASAVGGPDQLRLRVATALLETLVVSSLGLPYGTYEMAAYMDVLQRNAFGNFRQILEDVTLNPGMGKYLDMLQNAKEDPATGRNPNENYARELLQLFSIGLYELNADGSLVLDANGQPIATYDQAVVEGFAKAFTGWTYNQTVPPFRFRPSVADWRNPMIPIEAQHSTAAKLLLGGVTLPAGRTARRDLDDALDVVFAHGNVGPFIVRQLIQRLVTSNPSAPYVARVAAVFANNGAGVRGDMAAVVRAILLDDEARNQATAVGGSFGHVREPMIRFTTVLRAFKGRAASGRYKVWSLQNTMAQAPFRAPSVFNYFEPDYARPGPISNAGLVSPEFKITTETTAITAANVMRDLVYRGYGSTGVDLIALDLSAEQALATNPAALLNRLDLLLTAGRMSAELRTIVTDAVNTVSTAQPLTRARLAVHLVVSSPEFVVQK